MALVVAEEVDPQLLPSDAGVRLLPDRRDRPLRREAFFPFFEDGFLALGACHALELLAQLAEFFFLFLVELPGLFLLL